MGFEGPYKNRNIHVYGKINLDLISMTLKNDQNPIVGHVFSLGFPNITKSQKQTHHEIVGYVDDLPGTRRNHLFLFNFILKSSTRHS